MSIVLLPESRKCTGRRIDNRRMLPLSRRAEQQPWNLASRSVKFYALHWTGTADHRIRCWPPHIHRLPRSLRPKSGK